MQKEFKEGDSVIVINTDNTNICNEKIIGESGVVAYRCYGGVLTVAVSLKNTGNWFMNTENLELI